MSAVSIDQTDSRAEKAVRKIELPAAIRMKLQSVSRDNRKAEVRRSVALLAAVGLLMILVLVAGLVVTIAATMIMPLTSLIQNLT